jgi:raffinose/stachyose/melibiose transport system substrate-binding protein
VIEALTKIQQLVDAGGFVKGFSSVAADNSADQALLFSGKAAMVLQGGWIYGTMKQAAPQFVGTDLGFVPFPSVAGGAGDPAAIVGNPANFWSVSAKASAEQKKTAMEYLKDGLFSDTYSDGLIQSGLVPAVAGTETKLGASQDKDFLTYEYGMVTKAPTFQLSWDQALSPAQADALLTNLDLLFIKQSTPQQFADAMNATVGK